MLAHDPSYEGIGSNRTADTLAENGYLHLSSNDVARLCGMQGPAEWQPLARSWATLERDGFMGDGGLYRFRRHSIFRGCGRHIQRLPDAPHFQKQEHNGLNGGIPRTFAPVADIIGRNDLLKRLILAFMGLFDHASKSSDFPSWKIEMHQFRIVVEGGEPGFPTPEGMHRDGVDWVVTLFVDRNNVTGGATTLVDAYANPVARIEMGDPLEAILIDDLRLRHGVTPITVLDPTRGGHRDVLVLTFVEL